MKPENCTAQIFLDSGDPGETKEILDVLGFLDGQTTNPSLITKNPQAQERLARGEKFSHEEINAFYQTVVTEVAALLPKKSVSIEVYADICCTKAEQMVEQGKHMADWIKTPHIKLPITHEGLRAASILVHEGYSVNMTLCFSQEQAAAVHAATRGAKKGQVFVSPFDGRLDDVGVSGHDVIKNIIEMYSQGESHVLVLAASIRNLQSMLYAIAIGSDIVTVPWKILKEWGEGGMKILETMENIDHERGLAPVSYQNISLDNDWEAYNIAHDLTDKGLEKFVSDWKKLLKE